MLVLDFIFGLYHMNVIILFLASLKIQYGCHYTMWMSFIVFGLYQNMDGIYNHCPNIILDYVLNK
jgi:hypothetical protein